MNSFWSFETEVRKERFPPLSGDIKTDVLVVGGGVAGILCAYMLKKKGVRAIIIEAREILSGTSGNTTAKISFQHGLIYDKLIRSFGEERARIFLEGSKKACRTYEELAKTIPCDYEKKDSFVYSRKDRRKIEREIRAYQRLGEAAEFSVAERLPFPVLGAVCIPGQAEFNPLKFF